MTEEKKLNNSYGILYFSGTGNTEWVVKKIYEGLSGRNFSCEILSADGLLAEFGLNPGGKLDEIALVERLKVFVDGIDTLLVAFPTYASDVPLPLKQLLFLLPQYQGDGITKNLAVVSTIHAAGGDAVEVPVKILKKVGYEPCLTAYVKMPNNLMIPGFDFVSIANGEDLKPYYESAGRDIDEIVEDLACGNVVFDGKGVVDCALGAGQRLGEKIFGDYIQNNLFATAKCIKCGLCASTCPMANIDFSEGYPQFGKSCSMCMRCYNFCPVGAIQVTVKTMKEEKYLRYRGFDGWKPPVLRKVKEN